MIKIIYIIVFIKLYKSHFIFKIDIYNPNYSVMVIVTAIVTVVIVKIIVIVFIYTIILLINIIFFSKFLKNCCFYLCYYYTINSTSFINCHFVAPGNT